MKRAWILNYETTETRCNRPVVKKGNDGKKTRSKAGNIMRSASRGDMPSRMSEDDMRHRILR